jgi:biopolymer transport protein ExbB/TolQ
VAIVALIFFNYLQTRIGSLNAVYARSSERVVQALIYVESNAGEMPAGDEGQQ